MSIFNQHQEENSWISTSDLMSVLMIIFLFISCTYMFNASKEKKKIKSVAVTYEKLQEDLYNDLSEEFKEDLKNWNASVDQNTLSIRFEQPDILFKAGSSEIRNNFKVILDNFFPRFLQVLLKYKNDIEEIRIEGHTSSEWVGESSEQQAYFNNMELSQNRTRKVLEYVLNNEQDNELLKWAKSHLTANGLSSSKLIYNADNTENKEKSRRVEFRVRTNAEKQIINILDLN